MIHPRLQGLGKPRNIFTFIPNYWLLCLKNDITYSKITFLIAEKNVQIE